MDKQAEGRSECAKQHACITRSTAKGHKSGSGQTGTANSVVAGKKSLGKRRADVPACL